MRYAIPDVLLNQNYIYIGESHSGKDCYLYFSDDIYFITFQEYEMFEFKVEDKEKLLRLVAALIYNIDIKTLSEIKRKIEIHEVLK